MKKLCTWWGFDLYDEAPKGWKENTEPMQNVPNGFHNWWNGESLFSGKYETVKAFRTDLTEEGKEHCIKRLKEDKEHVKWM